MAADSIDQEIIALEKEYWDSMITKDPSVATRLTADESIIVGAQGIGVVSSDNIGQMVQSEGWKLRGYEFTGVQVKPLGPDNAIVAYHVTEDLEVDGEMLTLEANDSTVWTRNGGKWVAVLHTESLAGDPFGRDKKGAGT